MARFEESKENESSVDFKIVDEPLESSFIEVDEDSGQVRLGLSFDVEEEKKGLWTATCPELKISSCSTESKESAVEGLVEAVQLFLDSCADRGVLEEALEELGWR